MQQQKESGAKSKKLSKDRNAEERSITPRRSSRNKKPTEIYQAGLNSMQTSSNPRGYVDSSGRYRSYSRDRFPRDQSRQRSPSRQDRYKRSPSRQDRYQRQPSRDSYPRQDRYTQGNPAGMLVPDRTDTKGSPVGTPTIQYARKKMTGL